MRSIRGVRSLLAALALAAAALLACAPRLTVAGGRVELDQGQVEVGPFEVDQHAATAEEYGRCVEARACEPARSPDPLCSVRDPRDPLGCLRWSDAAAYCAYRSARLPTDAERSLLERSATGEPHRQPFCRGPGRDNPFGLCDVGGIFTWTTSDALSGPSERATNAPDERVPTLGARCVRSPGLPRVKSTGVPKALQTGVKIIQVQPAD